MGTINYKTSDFITLGYDLSSVDYEEEFYHDFIDDDFYQIEELLKQQYFYYYHITLEPGYYEGFTINIENNFPYCFNDYSEKQEAQKEVTQIKNFLIYIVDNFNICAVRPGWGTAYLNYKETISKIKEAAKEMKNEIKTTPTHYLLNLAGGGVMC